MLEEQTTQPNSPAYQTLIADMTARVHLGQLTAFRAVNKELIDM